MYDLKALRLLFVIVNRYLTSLMRFKMLWFGQNFRLNNDDGWHQECTVSSKLGRTAVQKRFSIMCLVLWSEIYVTTGSIVVTIVHSKHTNKYCLPQLLLGFRKMELGLQAFYWFSMQ